MTARTRSKRKDRQLVDMALLPKVAMVLHKEGTGPLHNKAATEVVLRRVMVAPHRVGISSHSKEAMDDHLQGNLGTRLSRVVDMGPPQLLRGIRTRSTLPRASSCAD